MAGTMGAPMAQGCWAQHPRDPWQPQTVPRSRSQEPPGRRRGRTRLTQVEPRSRGGPRPPPLAGPRRLLPAATPGPAVLSDGCGCEEGPPRAPNAGARQETRTSPATATPASSPPRCLGGPGGEHGSAGARVGPPRSPGSRPRPCRRPQGRLSAPGPARLRLCPRICGRTLGTWQCRHLGREQSRARPGVPGTRTRPQPGPGPQPRRPLLLPGAAEPPPPPQHRCSAPTTAPPAAPPSLATSPTPAWPRVRPGLSHRAGTPCSTPIPARSGLDPNPRHPTDTPQPPPPSSEVTRPGYRLRAWTGFVLQCHGASPSLHRVPTEPPHPIVSPQSPHPAPGSKGALAPHPKEHPAPHSLQQLPVTVGRGRHPAPPTRGRDQTRSGSRAPGPV